MSYQSCHVVECVVNKRADVMHLNGWKWLYSWVKFRRKSIVCVELLTVLFREWAYDKASTSLVPVGSIFNNLMGIRFLFQVINTSITTNNDTLIIDTHALNIRMIWCL